MSLFEETASLPEAGQAPQQLDFAFSQPPVEVAPDSNGGNFLGGEAPPVASPPSSSGGLVAGLGQVTPPSSSSGPGSVHGGSSSNLFVTPQVNQNDAALKAWKTSHNEKLKLQASDAQRRSDEELAKAKTEVDELYAEWDKKKKAQHDANLAAEKKFLAERDAAASGTKWSNVARYVDLKGIENGGGEKDVARMREVLQNSLSRK